MKRRISILVVAGLCGLGAAVVRAADFNWDGGGVDDFWSTAENWEGDTVPNGTIAKIRFRSGTCDFDSGSSATLGLTLYIGLTGTAHFTANGGSLTNTGAEAGSEGCVVGYNATDNGTLVVNSGNLTFNGPGLLVGKSGAAATTMAGGTIDCTGLVVAELAGSQGAIDLSGGTLTAKTLTMGAGTARVDIAGGTLVLDGNITDMSGYGGTITAYGGLGTFIYAYDGGTDTTAITAITAISTALKIGPSADAWIVTATDGTGPEQDMNYGSNIELRVGDSYHPRHNRSLMKFDLSGIDRGATITNAKLFVYCETGSVGLGLYEVADDTWTEMGVTWNNQPSSGGLIVNYGAVSWATWLEFDVMASVSNTFANPSDDLWSIALKGAETGGNMLVSLRSKEASGLEPYLEIGWEPPSEAATIVGWSVSSNNVIRLVVDASGPAYKYYPKTTTDLVTVPWGSVAHSDDGVNPYYVTNLNYSTSEGTNKVIYVDATNAVGFFGIDGEE